MSPAIVVMRILGFAVSTIGVLVLAALVFIPVSVAQQAPPQVAAAVPVAQPSAFLQKYCFQCHSGAMPEGRLGLDTLLKDPNSIGTQSRVWERVAEMVKSGDMPAPEANAFPSDA